MTVYAVTVETVHAERIPVVLEAGATVRCGWCPVLLHEGDTVWAFDDVPVGSSQGSACCTSCMLRPVPQGYTAAGWLRVVGVEEATGA